MDTTCKLLMPRFATVSGADCNRREHLVGDLQAEQRQREGDEALGAAPLPDAQTRDAGQKDGPVDAAQDAARRGVYAIGAVHRGGALAQGYDQPDQHDMFTP